MWKQMRFPIRWKVLVTLLFVVTLVVSIITFTMARMFHDDKITYIHDLSSIVALNSAEQSRSLIMGYSEFLATYARVMSTEGLSRKARSQMLQGLFRASLDKATTAIRSGAYDFLTKPFEELEVISAVVNRANEKVTLLERNKTLMTSLKKHTEELERLNTNLEDLAVHDGLTGLHNHRYFREALDLELSRSTRHQRIFSLVFMDVDHFKQFNDTFGHLAGDEALKGLSRIFEQGKRSSTVLARYGGEEFVALLPEATKDEALAYAELVRSRVEAATFRDYDGRELGKVTISLGVSTFPGDGRNGKNLMESADRALYQAKESGRNRVCTLGAQTRASGASS